MALWRRPDTRRVPGGAAPYPAGTAADRIRNAGLVFPLAAIRLLPEPCSCGSRPPWVRGLLVATGRRALSGLVWLGLTGVVLPPEAVEEVRSWCAGPKSEPAPCCTAALPADCRPEDRRD